MPTKKKSSCTWVSAVLAIAETTDRDYFARYAYFKKLDYFSTECIYSPNAYRGYARTYLKDLEALRPSAIIDLIYSGEQLSVKAETKVAQQQTCTRCGYMSSNSICKACMLLEGLNRGVPALGVRGEARARQALVDAPSDPGRTIARFERVNLNGNAERPVASHTSSIEKARTAARAF